VRPEGFNPMNRYAVALLFLSSTLFASAMALWTFQQPWLAIIVVCSPLFLLAATLAFEFSANRFFNCTLAPGSSWPCTKSFVQEFWLNIRIFGWQQPFRNAHLPDTVARADCQTPAATRFCVVLVHGLGCNRGLWNVWLQRCADDQIPVIAPNLAKTFDSIDGYIGSFDTAIRRAHAAGFERPIVVAHSMGGLVVRRWASESGNASRIEHLITIATPHNGAWLARLGLTQVARDMKPGGAWIEACDRLDIALERKRITCFYSNCDNLVFPAELAKLTGAHNVLLDGMGHLQMLDHPAVWAEVVSHLSERTNSPSFRPLMAD
jgi:triacylglycerol lipase